MAFSSALQKLLLNDDEEETDQDANVQSQIANARTRLGAAGVEDPTTQGSTNPFMDFLKNLSRTGHGASNVFREFTNAEGGATPDEFDPLQAFGRGFNLEEKPLGKDVVTDIIGKEHGDQSMVGRVGEALGFDTPDWVDKPQLWNPSSAGVLGLATDVVNPLDPINWLSVGTGSIARKGAQKGLVALEKSFGTQGVKIAELLGEKAVTNLGSKSVGGLMGQVAKFADDAGLAGDDLLKVTEHLKTGLAETGLNASSKLKFSEAVPLTAGLRNPLTLGTGKDLIKPMNIPGSELFTGPIMSGFSKFMGTKVGQSLGKKFSTSFVPSTVPDQITVRNITDNQNVFGNADREIAESVANSTHTMSGQDATRALKGDVHENYVIPQQLEIADLKAQIASIFKGVPQKEYDEVMEIAAGGYGGSYPVQGMNGAADNFAPELSEQGEAALENFIRWRETIVREYNGAGIPMEQLDNYVPHIPLRSLKPEEQEALQAAFGMGAREADETPDAFLHAIQQTDPNLRSRTIKGTTPREINKLLKKPWLSESAPQAMAVRGTRAIKGKHLSKFLKEFTEQYALDLSSIRLGAPPKGYKMFTTRMEGNGRTLLEEVTNVAASDRQGFLLPEEMARVFNEATEVAWGGKAKDPLLRAFDAATTAYKKVAYLWNPGHIPRDFIGNVWNGYLMGVVNPAEYARAAKLLLNPEQEVKLAGQSVKVQNLLDQANKQGLLDINQLTAEVPMNMAEQMSLKGSNRFKTGVNKYSQAMRWGTRKSDTLTRFTGLLHELDKGKSFTESAAQVKKFYFDYFDLTSFERKVMKRVVPFYTWMRKNIPLQLEQAAKNPRAFGRLESAMAASQGEAPDPDERPDFINDTGAFQMGKDGPYANLALPAADLGKAPTNLDSILKLLSSVNPIIKAPIEAATNNQWFTGREIEGYEGEKRDAPFAGLIKAITGQDVPGIDRRTTGHALDQIPLLRNLDAISNPDNERQMSRLSTFLGGPGVYQEENVARSLSYEQKQMLTDLLRKMKDEGQEVPSLKELKEMGIIE